MKATISGKHFGRWIIFITLVCLSLSLCACEALGPAALRAGRNDYNKAINTTDTAELLLNIVRLRFNDKPYMLQISNISSRSEWWNTVEGGYQFARTDRKGDSYDVRRQPSIGAELRYIEKPSIIYQPLRGARFVQQLLSPLDLETIFLVRFAGFPMNKILRVFARAINDVPNAPTAGDSTPVGVPQYEEFIEGIGAFSKLEEQGAMAPPPTIQATSSMKHDRRSCWLS